MKPHFTRTIKAREVEPGDLIERQDDERGVVICIDSVTWALDGITLAGRPTYRKTGRRVALHVAPEDAITQVAGSEDSLKCIAQLAGMTDGVASDEGDVRITFDEGWGLDIYAPGVQVDPTS